MANPKHLARLKEGAKKWNQWRKQHPDVHPDLCGANLHKAKLSKAKLNEASLDEANLSGANLRKADLSWTGLYQAYLWKTNLRMTNLSGAYLGLADLTFATLAGANLTGANFTKASLRRANVAKANLSNADLSNADLSGANLSGANLRGANLSGATFVKTNLQRANLTSCSVFGISAWNVRLGGAIQSNLVITPAGEPVIQVDNLEVAQFVYLLLNNEKIRDVIDTITSKVVLILGRFTPERKVVLDTIREELRKRDYLPILFDFEKPASKDLTGTVSTLANLARFIIADLTEPSSVPHELATVVPCTVVPVQAILLEGQREYAMFPDLVRRHHWVLEPYQYRSKDLLIANLNERVIAPAEAKAKELTRK